MQLKEVGADNIRPVCRDFIQHFNLITATR